MDLKLGVLYVDDRVGSRELAPLLRSRHGARVEIRRLPSADFAFAGHYRTGEIKIGIERKTLGDLCGSLLRSRLPQRQAPGMLKDYTFCWVVVEGLWRPGDDSAIQTPAGKGWVTARYSLTYLQLSGWLCGLEMAGGGRLKLWRTATPIETAAWVNSRFRWWQKPWHRHSSHLSMSKWGPDGEGIDSVPQKVMFSKPEDVAKVAVSFDGIGGKRARRVAKFFASPYEMVTAKQAEWVKAGLKPKEADKVWLWLRRPRW